MTTEPEKKKPGRPRIGSSRIVDGLAPEVWAQIDAIAGDRGVTRSAALRMVVDRGLSPSLDAPARPRP